MRVSIHFTQMMELKYLGVPAEEGDLESGERRSARRRALVILNQYAQITSSAYQHGMGERKLSFTLFLVMFVCFVFTLVFLFSGGDMCASHVEGLARLRAENDHLRAQLAKLTSDRIEAPPASPVIP